MKNIVLVGMMGSGKSTVSKILAEKLKNFSTVEVDEIIVHLENRQISDIFKDSGEEYFRELETAVIDSYSTSSGKIISTGGGACEKEENVELLKQNGIIFYLLTPVEELYERLQNDTTRPLLKTSNIKLTIEKLLKIREDNYKLATYTIDAAEKSAADVANEIIDKYYEHEKINS